MDDFFLIAKIKSVYKSEGYVVIKPYSHFSERFFRLKDVFIDVFGAKRKFLVEDVADSNNKLLMRFKNFDSSDDLDFLIGKEIFVEKKDLSKLPKDSYYIHDLVGSRVFRNRKFFGDLIDVLQLPSNDVYLIRDVDKREVMVPSSKDYVESFNPEKKELILRADCDLLYNDEN